MRLVYVGLVVTVAALAAMPFLVAEAEGVRVLDCRNASATCNESLVTERPVACDNWRPWEPRSDLACNRTSANLSEVSLVADAANYVTDPMRSSAIESRFASGTGSAPWDIEFLPDGTAIWTDLYGTVMRADPTVRSARPIGAIDVVQRGETGLLGLAVDPGFARNRYIYLYYTDTTTDRESVVGGSIFENHVSRFRLVNGSLQDETVLLEVPGSIYHSGGRLEFGPDGNLFVTIGDAGMEYQAGNMSFLGGKILRITPDGSLPADNPFNGSPVYSTGHRNPQGLAWSPDGTLYATEHGPWRNDEVNRIVPGENYGWAVYMCDEPYVRSATDPTPTARGWVTGSQRPVHCWDDWTMAPSGATIVDQPGHPWHGDLFVAGLRGKHLARFEVRDGTISEPEVFYASADTAGISLRLRDVEFYAGALYVIGDRGGIVRIVPG